MEIVSSGGFGLVGHTESEFELPANALEPTAPIAESAAAQYWT
jgi:hypothetical protein